MQSDKSVSASKKSNKGSEGSSSIKWDDSMNRAFIGFCVDEIGKGNRPSSHFNASGWNNILKKMNELTGRSFLHKQLRNHWDAMKKDWLLFKKLMHSETGIGWNPLKSSIDATDEWWSTKINENAEYKKFKNKDLSLIWFEYDRLFSDVAATGERARAPSQRSGNEIDAVKFNMESMDISDMIDYDVTLEESWNVLNCSSIFPTISFGEKIIEDEHEVQDSDWMALCNVTAKSILMYYENYIHKTLCRTSARTGHIFIEEILQGSEVRCYQAFRLTKSVFLDLCYELNHKYDLEPTRGMSTHEEVGIFLMTCAHGVDNRLLQEIFQHSGETISRHFHRVLKAVAKLANDIIVPHPGYNEGKGYHKPQHQRYMPFFKDCIGAIDGTHVKARLPEGKSIPYIGRKGYATQNILAVVDFNMCFTFVWAGWEGSAHDNRIFGEAIRNPNLNFPIPKGHKYYLVDAGYTHMPGYMGPYRGENLRYHLGDFRRARTKEQRKPRNLKEKFNYYHSSCRNCVERTFGVWKARWNILVDMPYFHIDTQREIVLATMAIHNYIRKKNILDTAFQIAEDENYEPIHHVTVASDGVPIVEDGGGHKNTHWLAVRDSIAMEIASRS